MNNKVELDRVLSPAEGTMAELGKLFYAVKAEGYRLSFLFDKADDGDYVLCYTVTCEHGKKYGRGGKFIPSEGLVEFALKTLAQDGHVALAKIVEDHGKALHSDHPSEGSSVISLKDFGMASK